MVVGQNRIFECAAQLFARQEVCVLRIVQGQPDAARRCDVPEAQKAENEK